MLKSHLDSDVAEIAARLGDAAQDLSGKTVLMTGGRGFLGRHFGAVFAHLNERVLIKPCRVVLIDNMISAGPAAKEVIDGSGVEFLQRDVTQPLQWEGSLDYIIHAAGIASPFYYRAYPLETLDVAVHGTRSMLELATRHHARFTFFSSSEIYGDPDPKHVPTPESYRGNVASRGPRACYDESKRLGETLTYVFHDKFGTATTIIRPFNVFGPGMQETDYRVLPNFASRIKAGKPLNVYGNGNQTRTFTYIVDAMVGFFLVMLRGIPGEVYNIGNPQPEINMLDLVNAIERVLKRPLPHNIIEYPDSYPADEPNRRCPDIRKARVHLNFNPSVVLDDGLRRFLNWSNEVYIGLD